MNNYIYRLASENMLEFRSLQMLKHRVSFKKILKRQKLRCFSDGLCSR